MTKKILNSRGELIRDINLISGNKLNSIERNLNDHWVSAFNKYKGLSIDTFKGAVKAGEITISEPISENTQTNFPQLKAKWNSGIPRTSSSYIITVDGQIAKIGALKSGVKGSSFGQYLTGITGSPSRRSAGGYTFLYAMLANGKKVEVYHVTMDAKTGVNIPTLDGIVTREVHYASRDIEAANIDVYREKSGGLVPFLNFKERNATYPQVFDELYDLLNKRILSTKKYTE